MVKSRMPIQAEAITPAGLPRAVRGYDCEATDDLLRRVARDYRQLVDECRQLRESTQTPTEAEVAAPRPEVDDVARTLIASAQRAARELRESTRQDCEAMLRKSRTRARELEEEGRQRSMRVAADAARVRQAATDLRERLVAALRAVGVEDSHPPASRPPVEPLVAVDSDPV